MARLKFPNKTLRAMKQTIHQNTLTRSVSMATKEVSRSDAEAIQGTEEHENNITEDESDKSRENETECSS